MITNLELDDRQRDVGIREFRRADDDGQLARVIRTRVFVNSNASRRAKIDDRLNADNDKHDNEFRR